MIQPHSPRLGLVCTKPRDTPSQSLTGIPSATAFISTTYCNTTPTCRTTELCCKPAVPQTLQQNWLHDEALLQASRDNHNNAKSPSKGWEHNHTPNVPQNRLGQNHCQAPSEGMGTEKSEDEVSNNIVCSTNLLLLRSGKHQTSILAPSRAACIFHNTWSCISWVIELCQFMTT